MVFVFWFFELGKVIPNDDMPRAAGAGAGAAAVRVPSPSALS